MIKGKIKVKRITKSTGKRIITQDKPSPWGVVIESGSEGILPGMEVLFAPSMGSMIAENTYVIDESEVLAINESKE